ncbi:acyl-CoA dehydrogenase family protein [Nocardia vaccinii]|uniref:acyl-CoA dehydrogenase family protein n=1 Tax=Nocardia vaccinii TaxID=1822 RepID=UPI0035A242F7
MSPAAVRPSERELAMFRVRVREFISDNAPPVTAREGHRAPENPQQEALLRSWFAALFAEGLSGGDWPVEYGGRADHHPLHDRIVSEEILRARAPRPVDQVNLAAHVLLHFGTAAQKQIYLPPIRRSEHIWCQLLSESDAGSDIAAVRSRAAPNSQGGWTLNGHKIWITDGHWADMGLALVRTDPSQARHHGLSVFLVPMTAPGMEVRPIRTAAGTFEINEVVFDEVALPPESLVGRPGQGWSIIMTGLEFERFGIGGNVVLLELLIDDLLLLARHLEIDGRPLIHIDDIRHRIAELAVEAEVAKAFIDDHVERMLDGADATGDAAVAKISFAETYHAIASFGAALASSAVPREFGSTDEIEQAKQRLRECWLWSRAYTISGGSTEMMRNVLAKRRLGLPDS